MIRGRAGRFTTLETELGTGLDALPTRPILIESAIISLVTLDESSCPPPGWDGFGVVDFDSRPVIDDLGEGGAWCSLYFCGVCECPVALIFDDFLFKVGASSACDGRIEEV